MSFGRVVSRILPVTLLALPFVSCSGSPSDSVVLTAEMPLHLEDHLDAATIEDAGADEVGGAYVVKKIQDGWMEFDAVVATPDMMKDVGRLGKILGPRGMMPNPKTGTVTFDVKSAVEQIKAGKVEYRVDKTSILHNSLGKVSFDSAKLIENVQTFMAAVVKSKPPAAKGKYLKSIHLSSTMGPSVKVDPGAIEVQAAA